MTFTIASFYRFVALPDCAALKRALLNECAGLRLLGTILLAEEGINGSVAGSAESIQTFVNFLERDERFKSIPYKFNYVNDAPFRRLKVRIKPEIVTLGVEGLDAATQSGDYVSVDEWDAFIARDDVAVIDTRNDYEVALGSFDRAIDPHTKTFRDFPLWAEEWAKDKDKKNQKVAMFCTGGIRCEKSTALMKQLGFENVYHLEGGILDYLEKTKNANQAWKGECFVFDERVAVDDHLHPTDTVWCAHCGDPVAVNAQREDSLCHACAY